MLVWTRWGIAIPFLGYLGALFGNYTALGVGQYMATDAPWLMASGWVLGAMAAALLLKMFDDWRFAKGGAPGQRTLIHEATGERITIPTTGDTFFWIHTRHWIWLALVIGVIAAGVTMYQHLPLREM